MTENLLLKLEEKMMSLLAEVEDLRKEVQQVHQENFLLKTEREKTAERLRNLNSLLDTVSTTENMLANPTNTVLTSVLIQGEELAS